MRWLIAIVLVALLVIGYLYYDEFGLPTRVEEFLENLTPDEEDAPAPTHTPARQAPADAPTPRDSDAAAPPTATPLLIGTSAPPTPTLRAGMPTPTPTTVPIPLPPTPTPEPTADPAMEVRCSQADDRDDIRGESQWYTTLEECLQFGNWYTYRGEGIWKSTAPTLTPTPLEIRPEKSELGLNPDGKAVWTFVVNDVTIYCHIGELAAPCAQRLGLSGIY
ncbi:MAG: hypothetical protein OXL97_09535 [Chloroflexota bacterium]|nr:hypothetical protein [Chloroflexota bacterium]MDE2885560.1 hypothetical protein [Chloroflexota bacterium]